MRSRKYWLPFLILFLLSVILFSCSRKVEKRIDQIINEDQEKLDVFFEVLFKNSPSEFTLLGNKPISFYCYLLPSENAQINEKNVFAVLMEEGWKILQKYPHIFTSNHFELKRTINPDDPLPLVYISLINKIAALNAIKENMDLFQKKYGTSFEPKAYLASLDHIAYEQADLVGILMGYGAKSSWLFYRGRILSQYYQEHPDAFEKDKAFMPSVMEANIFKCANLKIRKVVPDDLAPSQGFASLAEELNYITEHYSSFELNGAHSFTSEFCLPEFACSDCEEELALIKEDYKKTLISFLERNKEKSALEMVLEEWQKE